MVPAYVWGDLYIKHTNAMLLLQKRAARVIVDAAWDARPSQAIFEELTIIPFKERVARMKAKIVYKALNGLTPSYISEKFTLFNAIHNKNTRNSKNLILPQVKRSFGEHTFAFSAAKIWNSLDNDLKKCKTLSSFSKKL